MTNLITKTFRPDFQESIFDVLFRDVLDTRSIFSPLTDAKFHYPVDIVETKEGIEFEFAIVGVNKDEVALEIDNDILRIVYENKQSSDACKVIYRGITRKSFNFAWKLGGRFDTTKVEAKMEKGILNIKIPFTVGAVKKLVEIK